MRWRRPFKNELGANMNPYRKGSYFSFPPASLRVCAPCWLLHYFSVSTSDELKHIIGADTTRKGILRVFDMFQYQPMNRRLVYVFLEGFLETMFPQYKFPELFVKLHSRSPRIHRYSQRLKTSSLKRWQERTEAAGHRLMTRHTQTWELRVRVGGLMWMLGCVCMWFLPFHSPRTLFSVKTLQLSSWLVLLRQNWRMNNTHSALLSLCDTHTCANKSCILHQDWTWQSFLFSLNIFLNFYGLFTCV